MQRWSPGAGFQIAGAYSVLWGMGREGFSSLVSRQLLSFEFLLSFQTMRLGVKEEVVWKLKICGNFHVDTFCFSSYFCGKELENEKS